MIGSRNSLFEGLGASHLQLLTKSAMQMQFELGRQIFNEGEPSNRFYLILWKAKLKWNRNPRKVTRFPLEYSVRVMDWVGPGCFLLIMTVQYAGNEAETKTIFF